MTITVDSSVSGVKAATLNVNINGINTPLVSQLTAEILTPIAFVTPPDTLGLTWYGGGDLPWLIDPVILGPDGSSPVLKSDMITHNQKSVIMTELTGPGAFTFNWQSDSEQFYDFLIVYLDNQLYRDNQGVVYLVSGPSPWFSVPVDIPSGEHTLAWRYTKDGLNSIGQDAGWINQPSYDEPPVITLTGANPLIIAASGSFSEPEFNANDTVDGNLTASVTTSSSVPNPLIVKAVTT